MLKKTITYTDFDGEERTEDFYFNLTKAEIMEMNLSVYGGLDKMLEKIVAAKDTPKIVSTFKELVLKAYGVKSDDGKRFIKNDRLREEFSQTEAYSELFMELATDEDAAIKFVNGIVPKELADSEQAKQYRENHPALK